MASKTFIQPMRGEIRLSAKEQKGVDLVVEVDKAILNDDKEKIWELIEKIEVMKLGNGTWLIKRLKAAL